MTVRMGIDVLLVQERYTLRGKIAGFPPEARIVAVADDVKWAAVVVFNPGLDVVSLSQFTGTHSVVVEIVEGGGVYILGSVYCQCSLSVEPFIARMSMSLLLSGAGRPLSVQT